MRSFSNPEIEDQRTMMRVIPWRPRFSQGLLSDLFAECGRCLFSFQVQYRNVSHFELLNLQLARHGIAKFDCRCSLQTIMDWMDTPSRMEVGFDWFVVVLLVTSF